MSDETKSTPKEAEESKGSQQEKSRGDESGQLEPAAAAAQSTSSSYKHGSAAFTALFSSRPSSAKKSKCAAEADAGSAGGGARGGATTAAAAASSSDQAAASSCGSASLPPSSAFFTSVNFLHSLFAPLWRQLAARRGEPAVSLHSLVMDARLALDLRQGETFTNGSDALLALCRNVSVCKRTMAQPMLRQLPPSLLTQLRAWLLQANQLLEELAASLTAEEIRSKPSIVTDCLLAESLAAATCLARRSPGSAFETNAVLLWDLPYVSMLARCPAHHFISYTPVLGMIAHGLDPTRMDGDHTHSALQWARGHAEEYPAQAASGMELLNAHNLAIAFVIQQPEASVDAELQRRLQLHTRFMHALVAAWRSHSQSVRALLRQADPEVLIPDLADICADYLDLEPHIHSSSGSNSSGASK